MNDLKIFAMGVFVGGFVVAWAWALIERFWEPQRRRKVEVRIDAEVLGQVTQEMVEGWLQRRGLIWMPKGLEYMAKKEKR